YRCAWLTHSASAAYDSRRYPHHLGVKRVRHERQGEQQRDEDRKDLRHEHQGLFLDLRQRLEQRHHDADHKPNHHQRRRHHHDGPDRIARDVEGFSTGHFNPFSFTCFFIPGREWRVANSEWTSTCPSLSSLFAIPYSQ